MPGLKRLMAAFAIAVTPALAETPALPLPPMLANVARRVEWYGKYCGRLDAIQYRQCVRFPIENQIMNDTMKTIMDTGLSDPDSLGKWYAYADCQLSPSVDSQAALYTWLKAMNITTPEQVAQRSDEIRRQAKSITLAHINAVNNCAETSGVASLKGSPFPLDAGRLMEMNFGPDARPAAPSPDSP